MEPKLYRLQLVLSLNIEHKILNCINKILIGFDKIKIKKIHY